VFHTSLLRPFHSDGRHQPPPPPVDVDGLEEYEVEKLLAHRHSGRQREFLVKWVGYGPEENTWEPLKHLKNCPEVLAEYYAQLPPAEAGVAAASPADAGTAVAVADAAPSAAPVRTSQRVRKKKKQADEL
jgi:hypothetical protein